MNTKTGRQGIVWGGLLLLLGLLLLIETFTDLSAWVWIAALVLGGLGASTLYLADRSSFGNLIPSYVMWAIALMVALITLNVLNDEIIATFVLTAIALPFLVGFLRDRSKWGLLIPVYILLAVGLMVALIGAELLEDLLVAAYVMFAIAIPFLFVYVRDRKQWWALIPGGITAVIGLSFLIAEAAAQYIVAIALVIVGGWILARQFLPKAETGAEAEEQLAEADEPPAE
jgi:hypothetical protein